MKKKLLAVITLTTVSLTLSSCLGVASQNTSPTTREPAPWAMLSDLDQDIQFELGTDSSTNKKIQSKSVVKTKPTEKIKTGPKKGTASKGSEKQTATKPEITVTDVSDEPLTEEEWFEGAVHIIRENFDGVMRVESSYAEQWISFTPYQKGFVKWLESYAADSTVQNTWDGLVDEFVEVSIAIGDYSSGYWLLIIDPDDSDNVILAVSDGNVVHNPYATGVSDPSSPSKPEDSNTESDSKTPPHSDSDTNPKDDPNTEPEDDPDTEPEDDPDTEPEDDPDNEPEDDPDTDPEDDPEPVDGLDTEPEDDPDTEPVDGPDTEPADGPDNEPVDEPKPADNPDPKPEDNPDPKPEDDPDPKPEDDPDPKPEDDPETDTNIPSESSSDSEP